MNHLKSSFGSGVGVGDKRKKGEGVEEVVDFGREKNAAAY